MGLFMKSHTIGRSGPDSMGESRQRLLESYLAELYRWNVRLNLTTVPQERAWDRHIVEPLSILEGELGSYGWDGLAVADLGSGCGVPGIPCSVVFSPARLALIERDERKAAFLTHVCGMLGLAGVAVLGRSAEEVARDPDYSASFDLLITRAAGRLDRVIRIGMPLLRPGGRMVALVHPNPGVASLAEVAAMESGGLVERAGNACVLVRKAEAALQPGPG